MATPVSVKTTAPGSTTSFDVEIGATQENDLILILLAWRQSGTLAIAGYTALGAKSTTDAWDSQWFAKVAGSGVEANPTATTTGSASTCGAISHIFRGALVSGGAAAAISDISSTAGSVGASLTSHALVTTTADCTILHGAVWDTTSIIPTNIADVNLLGSMQSIVTGMGYQATATTPGAISTFTWTGSNATNTGRAWALAIKNDTNAEPPVRIIDGRVWLQLLGGFSSPTTGIPDSVTGLTAIDGLNMNTVANTTAGTLTIGSSQPVSVPWPTAGTSFTSTQNLTAAAWVGAFQSIAEISLSGKICAFPYGFPTTVNSTTVGAKGTIIVFVDNVNAWAAFTVLPRYKMSPGGYGELIIKPGTSTPLASGGTIDWTKIVNIGYFQHRPAGTASSSGMLFFMSYYESTPCKMVGGGAVVPITTALEAQYLLGGRMYLGASKFQGSGQLVNGFGLQLGDGTLATYAKHTAQSYDIPATDDSLWTPGASSVPFTIKASSSDTIDLRSAIITSSILQPFTIDAASSLSATLLTTGLSVIGRTFSDLVGYDWTSVSWTECDTVTIAGGGDLTNCTIFKTTSTNAALAISANDSVLTGCTIDGTGAAYALELDTGVTAITLTDCTITAGSSAKIHVLATTGTVTITISGSTVSPTYVSEGATVDISAPVITADISITGMPDTPGANNRLQIINTTAISAADWTANTPYTAGDVVLRTSGIGSENTAGLYFRATTGGTSHVTTEPTWDTTVGNTTTDGTVVWTTHAILYYDADPAATSLTDTYIDGEEFLAGETVEIRFAEEDPAVSFKTYSTSVVTTSEGFSALVIEDDDSSYATYATSGVTQDTIFSPNFVSNYIVLDTDTNFTASGAYAYYCYLLTTSEGMYRFWGGLTGIDPGNIRNNDSVVSLYFDCSSGFVRQTDDIRIFRSDGLRPALDPVTADGGGIEINWKVPVNVVSTGGSALTPTESAQLMALPSASITATAVGARTIEGAYSEDEILKLLAAALAGQRQGIGTATETYTGLDGATVRISLTPDVNGNGTPVLDVT